MMLYRAWSVNVLLVAVIYVKENNAQRANRGKLDPNPWTTWEKCSNPMDNCDYKRRRICADTQYPYLRCGNDVWEEKYKECLCVPPGIWYRNSTTKCQGITCREKIQMETLHCSDEINQRRCEKTTTKYCELEQTCDGSWGDWEKGECYKSSFPFTPNFQIRTRACIKNGFHSSNCAGTHPFFTKYKLEKCESSLPTASTTTATTTTTKALIPSLKTTTAFTSSVKVVKSGRKTTGEENNLTTKPIPEKDPLTSEKPNWWTGKTYILVIQSIIILVLVLIILYLLYLKKRKIKTVQPVMIEPSIRSPSFSQNWSQDVPQENQQDRHPPVYSQLLPNHRLSCPDFQRPLPEIPPSYRPPKPPRRNRASTQPAKFYKNSPSMSSFLTVPQAPQVTSSAPTSPVGNETQQDPFLLHSLDDAIYLSPIN